MQWSHKQTHIQVKCLHECHMSCMRCHHAHIPSHSPTPSDMHMPSVKTVTSSTNNLFHFPMQVPMGNQSRVNPDSYHTTRSLCDKCKNDHVSSLGNKNFWISPQVSYTFRHFLGFPRWIHHLTNIPGFSSNSLFLLHPTHIVYIYFYA